MNKIVKTVMERRAETTAIIGVGARAMTCTFTSFTPKRKTVA